MRKKCYTVEKMVWILCKPEVRMKTEDLACKCGVSRNIIYRRKSKLGDMEISDVRVMKDLEEEKVRLEKMVVEEALEYETAKALIEKSGDGRSETNRGLGPAEILQAEPTEELVPEGFSSLGGPILEGGFSTSFASWPNSGTGNGKCPRAVAAEFTSVWSEKGGESIERRSSESPENFSWRSGERRGNKPQELQGSGSPFLPGQMKPERLTSCWKPLSTSRVSGFLILWTTASGRPSS